MLRRVRQSEAIVLVCVVATISQLGFGLITPVVALYARSFGIGAGAVGLVISVYGLSRFLISLPAGRFGERFGQRLNLLSGLAIMAVGNLLCAVAPSYSLLLVFRFAAGAGAAIVLVASQVILADVASVENRGRAMSIYQGAFYVGLTLGPLPGGLLANAWGLRAPFYGYAALAAVTALVVLARLREGSAHPAPQPSIATAAAARSNAPRRSTAAQIRALMTHPGFLLVCYVSLVQTLARTGGIFNIIPLLAEQRLGLGPAQIGLGMSIINLLGVATIYPSGWIADRFGRKPAIWPATILAGVVLMGFAVGNTYGLFLLACAAWGMASGLGGPPPIAYAADVSAPIGFGTGMGVYRALSDAGYVIGPVGLGWLADHAGFLAPLDFTALLFVAGGVAFWLLAPETGGRRLKQAVAAAAD